MATHVFELVLKPCSCNRSVDDAASHLSFLGEEGSHHASHRVPEDVDSARIHFRLLGKVIEGCQVAFEFLLETDFAAGWSLAISESGLVDAHGDEPLASHRVHDPCVDSVGCFRPIDRIADDALNVEEGWEAAFAFARLVLGNCDDRAQAIPLGNIDAAVAELAPGNLFSQFSKLDLECTLTPIPQDFDRGRLTTLEPAHDRSKRFECWNGLTRDRADCIPSQDPGRRSRSAGNDLLYGNPIGDLRIDPNPHRSRATRQGRLGRRGRGPSYRIASRRRPRARRFLCLRVLQGGEEDQNQQTRNEISWTDVELGVRHGEVDSKDS